MKFKCSIYSKVLFKKKENFARMPQGKSNLLLEVFTSYIGCKSYFNAIYL